MIGTTRFSEQTYQENKRWRESNQYAGCIYGTPRKMAEKIRRGREIYVIEMNNTVNQVMGIGKIKNESQHCRQKYRMYKDDFYNRYTYMGECRVDRKDIKKEKLLELEKVLFYGKGHMKRGSSITCISHQKVDVDYIKSLF